MITANDILLEFPEILSPKNENDCSYFGWEGIGALALETMAEGYFTAAEVVYDKFKSSENKFCELDKIGYPICFLYRHYMELYIKCLFFQYGEESEREKYLKKGHNLDSLWNGIKSKLLDLQKRVESSISIPALTSYIHQMHEFDKNSFSMRYPINKDLSAIHPVPLKLNVVNLHDRMKEFKLAIETLNCDISNQILYDFPDDQLASMESKITGYKNEILKFLEITKQARNESVSVTFRNFDSEDDMFSTEKKEYQKFIESQKSDIQRLIYDMFECGRKIIQSCHLPKETNEKKKDVLILMVKQANAEIPEKDVLLLYETKGADCLYQYIHKVVDELGIMTDKDE